MLCIIILSERKLVFGGLIGIKTENSLYTVVKITKLFSF